MLLTAHTAVPYSVPMLIATTPCRLADLPAGRYYVPDGRDAVRENVYRKIDATRAQKADRALKSFTFIGDRLVREVRSK